MKRFVRSWLIFTFAAVALVASGPSALAGPPAKNLPNAVIHLNDTTYSVTLTGTPVNQVPFTLTAKVMQLPPNTMARGATPFVDPRLRYTFKAQRTWPCADTNVTIATNSSQSAVPWNTQGVKAGEYTVFTVHVTTVQNPLDIHTPKLPDVIGDGTLTLSYIYTVNKPTGGVPTVWAVSPPAGSTGPVTANVTSTVNFPPEFTQFRFTITCNPYCQPASGTRVLNTSNNSYPILTTTIAPPPGGQSGGTQLYSYVDQVHFPDCLWVGSSQAYKFDYWIKAP